MRDRSGQGDRDGWITVFCVGAREHMLGRPVRARFAGWILSPIARAHIFRVHTPLGKWCYSNLVEGLLINVVSSSRNCKQARLMCFDVSFCFFGTGYLMTSAIWMIFKVDAPACQCACCRWTWARGFRAFIEADAAHDALQLGVGAIKSIAKR